MELQSHAIPYAVSMLTVSFSRYCTVSHVIFILIHFSHSKWYNKTSYRLQRVFSSIYFDRTTLQFYYV